MHPLPGAVQAPEAEVVVDGLPGWEVVWQKPPGTAAPYDVEDGVEDLTRRIETRTPTGFGSGKVKLQAAPFGIGEIGLICFSHARYPTERAPQNPFSDSFMTEFSEVRPAFGGHTIVCLIRKMLRTAPAQMANRQTKNATVECRPNLLNGASVRALSTTSSATLASMAATDAIERKALWIIRGHYIPSMTSSPGPSSLALIHPSDPWPLAGHPEAMKMEPPPRLFSHQCLEVEFCELRVDGVLRSSLAVT
jgi:hypothetical protein